jgi:hypothetical protein
LRQLEDVAAAARTWTARCSARTTLCDCRSAAAWSEQPAGDAAAECDVRHLLGRLRHHQLRMSSSPLGRLRHQLRVCCRRRRRPPPPYRPPPPASSATCSSAGGRTRHRRDARPWCTCSAQRPSYKAADAPPPTGEYVWVPCPAITIYSSSVRRLLAIVRVQPSGSCAWVGVRYTFDRRDPRAHTPVARGSDRREQTLSACCNSRGSFQVFFLPKHFFIIVHGTCTENDRRRSDKSPEPPRRTAYFPRRS